MSQKTSNKDTQLVYPFIRTNQPNYGWWPSANACISRKKRKKKRKERDIIETRPKMPKFFFLFFFFLAISLLLCDVGEKKTKKKQRRTKRQVEAIKWQDTYRLWRIFVRDEGRKSGKRATRQIYAFTGRHMQWHAKTNKKKYDVDNTHMDCFFFLAKC